MATAAEPFLITVKQFQEMPKRPDVIQELHCGHVVTMTFPKKRHTKLQSRLIELLSPKALPMGLVAAEFPFRALPEYDLRAADVAFVSRARWDATDDDENLRGAPELVIEVLSPSNTQAEIREKAALCLSNGAEEFWIVDPKRRTVIVTRKQGNSVLHKIGDRIPLLLFDAELEAALIFD